jgi:hypothetical protein
MEDKGDYSTQEKEYEWVLRKWDGKFPVSHVRVEHEEGHRKGY